MWAFTATFKELPSLLAPTHNPRFLDDTQQLLFASGMTHHVTFLDILHMQEERIPRLRTSPIILLIQCACCMTTIFEWWSALSSLTPFYITLISNVFFQHKLLLPDYELGLSLWFSNIVLLFRSRILPCYIAIDSHAGLAIKHKLKGSKQEWSNPIEIDHLLF